MAKPKALVIAGDGINCDYETAWALSLAGFAVARMHDSELLQQPQILEQCQLCAIPGGFSFGDEIASGKVLGIKLKERLNEALYQFVDRGSLLMGICNGFQVLVQMGMLPHSEPNKPRIVSLMRNSQKKFINRWVKLVVSPEVVNPYFVGMTQFELPVRHGEGRLALETERTEVMKEHDMAHPILGIGAASGANLSPTTGGADLETKALVKNRAPLRYATDVNGSFDRIAALTNARGNVLGIMPHPEAFVRWTQYPNWTSHKITSSTPGATVPETAGLTIFRNAARHLSE